MSKLNSPKCFVLIVGLTINYISHIQHDREMFFRESEREREREKERDDSFVYMACYQSNAGR